MANQLINFFCF